MNGFHSTPSRRSTSGPRLAPRCGFRAGAFTLVEVLVACGVIGLLAAVMLPSLSRGHQQARMLICQANARQLATGFVMYSCANQSRLPGTVYDAEADWLGGGNHRDPRRGRIPDDGTLWSYMGRQREAYTCPDDHEKRASSISIRSYSGHFILAGAVPERLIGAHYRDSGNIIDPLNYSELDHRAAMKRFDGVPLIIEEHPGYWLTRNDDGGWANDDRVADRHFFDGRQGWGTMAYVDSHVGRVQLRAASLKIKKVTTTVFTANSLCVRMAGGKWVSGRSWSVAKVAYGQLDEAPSAEEMGVQH